MEPYVVLARKYRPGTFSEVLGQEAIASTLVKAVESGRVAHAYLFCGPRGIGKTSMARILAKALCCRASDGPTSTPCGRCDVCVAVSRGEDVDVIEIDGASNRGIEEVRTLRDNARYSPARARLKMYIIDEVHMLTPEAFNALLKLLEEPPPHVKFVFATTEPQKVPPTILSRCQRFDFRRIPTTTIVDHLKAICEKEGVETEEPALFAVARASVGGMRDAQSLLDQLITLGGGRVSEQDLADLLGSVASVTMEELFRAVAGGDEDKAIRVYEEVHNHGVDAAEFLKQALSLFRDILVLETCGRETDLVDLPLESRAAIAELAGELGSPRIVYALGLFSETLRTVKAVGEGRALVELALVKLARAADLLGLDEILADLKELKSGGGGGSPPRPSAPPGSGRAAPSTSRDRGDSPATGREGEQPPLFHADSPADGAMEGEETVTLTLDLVKERFPAVLDRVREESSAVATFLESGRPVGLSDGSVTVGFPPGAAFQRRQLDTPERVQLVEAAFLDVLDKRLSLESVLSEGLAEEEKRRVEEVDVEDGVSAEVTRAEIDRVQREPIVALLKDLLMARLVHIERA